MNYFRHFLLSVILCCGSCITVEQDTLKVSLYYESLCPDSVRFIVQQLYPGYQKLGNVIDLDFVPYGFATSRLINKHWHFNCQHGPRECYGNKIQACSLLQQNVTQQVHLAFIYCVMGNADPSSETGARRCASATRLSWDSINECLSSGKGDDLLVGYGNRTENVRPKIKYVPTIIFNDVFNQTLQDDSERNFLQTACDLLKNKPSRCNSENRNETR